MLAAQPAQISPGLRENWSLAAVQSCGRGIHHTAHPRCAETDQDQMQRCGQDPQSRNVAHVDAKMMAARHPDSRIISDNPKTRRVA